MKCIFCLEEKPPSLEHVIPESIGGNLCIKEVCRECNSELSRLVDNPFADCSLIQAARYHHSLGGKRDNIPFPFGGVGTTETGLKVTLDKNFMPHVERGLEITDIPNGGFQIKFSADASDKDKFERMLGKPLRKALEAKFPSWSQEKLNEEIRRIVEHARAQSPRSDSSSIKKQLIIGLDDLCFEFLKIAYEMWFRRFGYVWIENSETAKTLRAAILNRDNKQLIRGARLDPVIPLPVNDPLKNHLILQSKGACVIRLFNISYAIHCEETQARFMLDEKDYHITIQDFLSGYLIEEKLPDFLAKNLPTG